MKEAIQMDKEPTVKFTQIRPTMFGGFYALDNAGQVWHFDRYNAWNKIPTPDCNATPVVKPETKDRQQINEDQYRR